jgi:hypothetical protein
MSPIPRATVKLSITGTPDTLRTISGQNGFFLFKNVPAVPVTLYASSVGYLTLVKSLRPDGSKEIFALGDLVLGQSVTVLQEVYVATPPIQVKEDTVEYKADSFRVKPNAMVEDLLRKLPGMQVDKNGDITAHGRKVTRIKVNGKDFFGGDPKTATRELPADIIDKVQVVDDYGDLAAVSGIRDGEPEKVINLQIKKDKNKGIFGRASAGYGTDDRYQASGNANFFDNNRQLSLTGNANNVNNITSNSGNGGFSLNERSVGRILNSQSSDGGNAGGGASQPVMPGFTGLAGGAGGSEGQTVSLGLGTNFRNDFSNKKGLMYGSYTFSRRMTDINRDVTQQNFYETNSFTNNQQTSAYQTGYNHRAYLHVEYSPDSFNYIKVSPQFTYGQTNNQTSTGFEYIRDQTLTTSEGRNKDSAISKTPNFGMNLVYNHRFRKRGRNFSMNLNLGLNLTDRENETLNITNNLNLPQPVELVIRQSILQNNTNRTVGFRFNYTEPLARNRFLDLIYSYNYSFTRNDRETYNRKPNGDLEFSPALSNAYENDFVNQRYGASIRTVNKKYNYTLGFTVQPVSLNGYSITKDSAYTPRNQVNIFPVARLAYNFSRTRTLMMNYQGNARQPTFTQLQPVRDISNPQYQTQGNPGLKSEQYHNLSVLYNNFNFVSGKVFFTGVNLSLIRNQIVQNNIRIGNSGAQLTMPQNVNGYYNVSAFYTFSKPWNNRRYVLSLNGLVNYNHNITLVDSLKNVGNNGVISQGAVFEFNHKDWLEWDAGLRYGLNSTWYTLGDQQDYDYSSWTITSNCRLDIAQGWVLRYDFEYTLNEGLAIGVNQNLALLNASVEKTILKKRNGFIRLSGFDLLNQNISLKRTVSSNSITDTRTNRLTRYFMVSFTYRLNRFKGQAAGQMEKKMMK